MAEARGSAEWWRDRLIVKYTNDVLDRDVNAAYYDSLNPSPPVVDNETYRRILGQSKTPWGRLVVDIVAERIAVNGFRVGEDIQADADLWSIFRRNRMEALQRQVHREALALGTSYVSVWPDDRLGSRLAFESAMSVTHETSAGDPHETAAAIKLWYDPTTGLARCNLYLPEVTYKYASEKEVAESEWQSPKGDFFRNIRWTEPELVDNPLRRVPIIPFVVRPNWQGYGTSDLEDLRSIISRIESLIANTQLAVELGAFRQKWATGIEIPKSPDGDDLIEPFKVALDRLWTSGDPDTKFGAFDATDIRPYLQAVSDAIAQLSSVSRIPTLYFNQSELSNPPSAASLEATETGLIKKVNERIDRFSESWEQVATLVIGDDEQDIMPSFEDPRTRSEAQMLDAAVKLSTLTFPFQAIVEYLGYAPDEVERIKRLRSADTFDRLLQTPLPGATRINQTEQPAQADDQAE